MDPFGEVRLTGEAYELVFERRLAKSVEKVWAALTTPARIADWLAPCEIDLRPGGRIAFLFPGHPVDEQTIVELDPPRLFAWTWRHPEHPDSIVRFELTPAAEGCVLRLTQGGLPGGRLLNIASGWHTHLEGLPGAAEGIATPWRADRERRIAEFYRDRLPA